MPDVNDPYAPNPMHDDWAIKLTALTFGSLLEEL